VEFGRCLDAAVEEVKRALKGGGVAILVPPGSARGVVAMRLVEEGVVSEDDVLLYEGLHRRSGVGRPFRRVGEQFYVGEEPLLRYLKRGESLKWALRKRKVVIVPRDTAEALLIRKTVLKELEEEGKWYEIEYIEDVVIEVLFLPAYCQGEELAIVDYRRVLGGVVKKAIGFSPSLLRLAAAEPKLAREALEVFSALDPGRYFGEGLLPMIIGAGISASFAEFGKEGLKELVVDLIKIIRGSKLKQFFASVLKALRYIDDQRVEARVDEAAAKWGLTMEDFKALLRSIADYIVTCEELERFKALNDEEFRKAIEELVEEKWIELAERIIALEEEVKEMRRRFRERIKLLNLSPGPIYIGVEEWPYVEEVEGEARLKRGLMGGGPLVYNSLVNVVAKRLRWAAERGGGVVVVMGGKGVGKSTAAAAAVYHFLMGVVKVGERVYKPIAVEVKGEVDWSLLKDFVATANVFGYLPVLYFDPSTLPAYPRKVGEEYVPEASAHAVKKVVARLVDVVELWWNVIALVILSDDQYWSVASKVLRRLERGTGKRLWEVDAGGKLRKERADFIKALVEKYSGCSGEAVERVADVIASSFRKGYVVATVLAADWLRRRGCNGREVERAVEEIMGDIYHFLADIGKVYLFADIADIKDVYHFVLHYLLYGLFNGDEAVAERHAPLLLAVGFFGPHPPKLARAVVRAFGREPEGAVVRWLSQPLHSILYETIRGVAHGAVARRFNVGSGKLCGWSREGPCRLVEICSEALVGVPRRRYNDVEEVVKEYAKVIAERLRTPGPAGVRQIDFLIDDFLRIYEGVAEGGRWSIRYEVKGPEGVKVFEDIVDELDILSALYGLAVLPDWHRQLEPLEDWFFVNGKKVGIVALYLYPILRKRGRELVNRAVAIVSEIERRGNYTDVDVWRAVGIAATGRWKSATDEELEKAVKLAAYAVRRFATSSPTVLFYIRPLLSEAWRRVIRGETYEDKRRLQGLANWLSVVASNIAIEHPLSLLRFFTVGIGKRDIFYTHQVVEASAERFDMLYNSTSIAGKLQLLETLVYTLGQYIGVAAILLGKPELERQETLEEVVKRVEEFISHLDGVEKAYAVARLYPRLAAEYAYLDKIDEALKFAEESLKALDKLWIAYEKDKAPTEDKLRPYLELRQVKPDLWKELNSLNQYVYYHVASVYMDFDKLDKVVECAEKACKFAKELGNVYDEVSSCGLPLRLKVVRDGAPLVKEFEELWQRALQAIAWLDAEPAATTLGEYIVALASVGRLGDVEKVLEERGWALELHPVASALTYGVLSLFDGRHLEKAVGYLPKGARAKLPKFADALHDALKMDLFTISGRDKLTDAYGEDIVMALEYIMSSSVDLFLSALVGLAHCKSGTEWGLKLARAAARLGSQRFKGIPGRLFGELYNALESTSTNNCVTDEVLKAVYKLYYRHV